MRIACPSTCNGNSEPPLEDELELDELELLDDELDELLLELDDELLEDDELEELDDESPSPTQAGSTKLPSWLPWKPKDVLCPGCRLPFQLMLLAVTILPDVLRLTFQLPVTCGASLKFNATCQLLIAVAPLLVTLTFS